MNERPAPPDVMGITEIAQAYNLSRQRIDVLSHRPGFPHPWIVVAAGPIWLADDVRAFMDTRNTTPGRPRKAPSA